MREFIGDYINIDGRMIGYRIDTAYNYLQAKGLTDSETEDFIEENYEAYLLISQIIAVKQSCWLLRRTSHSCGSLSDHMYLLKIKLIKELREKQEIEFDDELMERHCHNDA